MAEEIWHTKYYGVVAGYRLEGTCAACEYQGPTDDFRVWHRAGRHKLLCNQCSSDVRLTMAHQGWQREEQ